MTLILPVADYDDWRWSGSAVNPPGAASPAVLTEVSTNEWHWQFVNNNVLVCTDQQIPHDYEEGTNLQPHIHFAPTTTATYTGTWTIVITDWLSVSTGSAKQAQTTLTAAFNSSMTAHQCQSIDFSSVLTGTNRKISSCATVFLSLAMSAGTALYLLGLDAHYKKNSLGSRLITSK
jgi:hypothetical protein